MRMKEDTPNNNLVESIILLVRIQNLIRDSFFADKFRDRIRLLLVAHINLEKATPGNVAQYNVLFETLNYNINNLAESLQDMAHINILKTSPLFLRVGKSLLILKLEAIRKRNIYIAESGKSSEVAPKEISAENIQIRSRAKKSSKLNESKKKILDFIKSYPDSRTKDIITEFSIFSDRTVKRNLMELLQTGLVKKRVDNKAVYYSTAD